MNTKTIADKLLCLIRKHPGNTEGELAEILFGPEAYQQRVNGNCRLLIRRRLVERRGEGGPSDPYRYYLTDTP